ncbi:hypothetical protein IGI66_003126 [Enterococcus sp. AZ048]|uniref:GNAT family N-acetyltransferase n=1 Tax=Enterococcus sp. AZ048 TaxID=2774658 RepID=UPI003F228108
MRQHKTITPEIRKLLSFSPLQYMLDTVEENPQLAKIFADDNERPKWCLLIFGHYIWIAGNIENREEEISSVIAETDQEIVIIFYDALAIPKMIKSNFASVFENVRSLFYVLPVQKEITTYEGVAAIDQEMMSSDISNLGMIIEEVSETASYSNLDSFLQEGIGYAFLAEDKVQGFCTSEYQSSKSIAIGIELSEEYQRRGIASNMVRLFLNEASKRKLAVYWDCWKENVPSIKTAKACGFTKIAEYPVVIIDKQG